MKTESGWLIEVTDANGMVKAPAQYVGAGESNLTHDHMKAVRFCRKEDAQTAIRIFSDSIYKGTWERFSAIEHQWDIGARNTDN